MEPSVKAIEILKLYKQLNRTVQIVFKGDIRALNAAKVKIRSEFEEKRNIKETKSIKELMKSIVYIILSPHPITVIIGTGPAGPTDQFQSSSS